ncbi:carbon-nitrogen hydrolase family protein [Arsenicicoccus sp. MKL-02]|uniref:Carbon-nitrogen hydrolase family protein n=1 Tax=Arsenicicoccus cauae TaxID=2663847 RepID=A0A6I3IK90_9MICO|nr:carbon-nitrogen hydrolase family protein [Arsenicicoccus cauae]MTB70390.1 carbon-nitrogen hydrolase family protein [Arsenicicoccus cauae]UKS89415.1 nitrilase [synthetic construct]
MVEYKNKFRVATTQIAPVWLDAQATVDKAIAWAAEAADNGAELIAFPEVFVPGYPYHLWGNSALAGMAKFTIPYHQNSLTIDGPEVQSLQAAAAEHKIAIVMGISERAGASLYMTQLIIDPDGKLVAGRRKLKPTHLERSLFGEGNGSDLAVFDLPMARVGALNCWEHVQPLSKMALYSQHEQVHVASWPGMSLYQPEVFAFSVEAQLIATRSYALEGGTFVLCSTQVVDQAAHETFTTTDEERKLIGSGGGFGRIFGPDGSQLSEALPEDAEGILYADVDLAMIALAKQSADPVGHYARPDVYSLHLNTTNTAPAYEWREPVRTVNLNRDGAPLAPAKERGEPMLIDSPRPQIEAAGSEWLADESHGQDAAAIAGSQ